MSRTVKLILTGIAGAGLMILWWRHYGTIWSGLSSVHFGMASMAIGLLGASIGVQWVRTSLLVGEGRWRCIGPPVVFSHGVNVIAPSLLGDLMEIALLGRILNRPSRAILVRLLFRFSATLAALGALAGLAVGAVEPSLGFLILAPSLILPFAVDLTTPWWSRRIAIPSTQPIDAMSGIGLIQTAGHTLLSVGQHLLSAASVFVLGASINEAVSPAVAAGMLALADVATYLPVPLGGVGLHHWSVSSVADLMGSVPTGLVLVNHALIVFIGGGCALAGWWSIADKSLINGQNE
jgi:hypothetical protein